MVFNFTISSTSKLDGHIMIGIKNYFENSSIHGLRYITQSGRHITERIFWAAVSSFAWYCTYLLFAASFHNYQYNAVSFVVDTANLNWNTSFPAVSLCETEEQSKIFETASRIFGRGASMDFYLTDIAFYGGSCQTCSILCKKVNCSQDFEYLANQVRASCSDILTECSWNGVPFECCDEFIPLPTEMGICYSFNSLQTQRNKQKVKSKYISNRRTGTGELYVKTYENAMVYLHSAEEIPFYNHPIAEKFPTVFATDYEIKFQVIEIENDPAIKDLSIFKRNCRFPNENMLNFNKLYSYSSCISECRLKEQIKLCNCTHHFQPKVEGVEKCNLDGLICLSNHTKRLNGLTSSGNATEGLVCRCMSSCQEPEYTIISTESEETEDEQGARITIKMNNLPSRRFKRELVRSKLDLVVSMGSAAGLFLGASLLSAVELFYFMFVRSSTCKPPTWERKKSPGPTGLNSEVKGIRSSLNYINQTRTQDTISFKMHN